MEIHITFSNGEKWSIPATIIASNRAKYYAENDPDSTFNDEFLFAMKDDYVVIDWLKNNMDWNDVKPHAIKIDTAVIEYDEEFCNAECEIVRKL